jgi:hypothetical protein
VAALAARARADRVAAGQVEAAGVLLHDGNPAGHRDWIITRHNDRRLSVLGGTNWVKNGNAWHVEARHPDGALTVRHVRHGGRVTLPPWYVASYVELLYATTAHRAMGDTVDTAHPLITAGMTREAPCVLASRARQRTTFYVATHDQPFDDDPRVDRARTDPGAHTAREVLLNIIATEGATLSATETITLAQQEAGSLATLVPEYLHVAHQDAGQRYQDATASALRTRRHGPPSSPRWAAPRMPTSTRASCWPPWPTTAGCGPPGASARTWPGGWAATWPRPPDPEHATLPGPARPPREVLLPWIQRPRWDGDGNRPLGQWLTEAGDLITARVDELAATAVRHRPPWMLPLGQPPGDPEAERQWLRHVGIIAAYRDQQKITSDDLRQVLGPYPESGRAGHKAYWHAARRLAGLDAPAVAATAEAQAHVQLAADIYRALPDDERASISTEMAARLGPLWFGNPTKPDTDAVSQPAHAATLTSTLIERGAMTIMAEPARFRAVADEPLEATFARRPQRRHRHGECLRLLRPRHLPDRPDGQHRHL